MMYRVMNTWTPGDKAQNDVDELKKVVYELKKVVEDLEKSMKKMMAVVVEKKRG